MATPTPTPKKELRPAGCGGDGCEAKDPWPLHHFRHRGNLYRFCTSCVLKNSSGSFCSSCFDLVDSCKPSDPTLEHCDKCPNVAHRSCHAGPDKFLCPVCKNQDGFSFFPSEDGRRRSIDLSAAKVLLAAAKLAANSMSRAAAAARAEAERKVKDAALAKKRAREMLEQALAVSRREKEKMLEAIETALVTAAEGAEQQQPPKKKAAKPGNAVAVAAGAQKRVQNREREKWMRFHEPILAVKRAVQGAVESEKVKGTLSGEVKDRGSVGAAAVGNVPNNEAGNVPKNVVGNVPNNHALNNVVKEEEKNGTFLGPQSGSATEEKGNQKVDGDKVPRIQQQSQGVVDALVSRNNPRAIFTGSPSTASLHS